MAQNMENHNRRGYRLRIKRKTAQKTEREDAEYEDTEMTQEEIRENTRQEFLIKQENAIRANAEKEALDYIIIMCTTKEFDSEEEYYRIIRNETLSFLNKFDIIQPSLQLKIIKSVAEKYLDFRYELVHQKTKYAKNTQSWWQWLFNKEADINMIEIEGEDKIKREARIISHEKLITKMKILKAAEDHGKQMDYSYKKLMQIADLIRPQSGEQFAREHEDAKTSNEQTKPGTSSEN